MQKIVSASLCKGTGGEGGGLELVFVNTNHELAKQAHTDGRFVDVVDSAALNDYTIAAPSCTFHLSSFV